MQKGIKNQYKIDAKSMQEKGMQKVWKIMTKGSQNGSRNPSKIEKVMEKMHAKKQRRNLRPKKIRFWVILPVVWVRFLAVRGRGVS